MAQIKNPSLFLVSEELVAFLETSPKTFTQMEQQPMKLPGHPGEQKNCFQNATHSMLMDPSRFLYTEGMAKRDELGLWMPHAWVWDNHKNQIVDNTWACPADETISYQGIFITHTILMDHLMNQGYYGVFHGYRGFDPVTINAYRSYFYG